MEKFNLEDFETLKKEFEARENDLLKFKGDEYAQDVDRLQNFREIGLFMNTSLVEPAIFGLVKQVQGIKNQLLSGHYSWSWTTPEGGEGLKQRFADARNYLLLLAGCVEDLERCRKAQFNLDDNLDSGNCDPYGRYGPTE